MVHCKPFPQPALPRIRRIGPIGFNSSPRASPANPTLPTRQEEGAVEMFFLFRFERPEVGTRRNPVFVAVRAAIHRRAPPLYPLTEAKDYGTKLPPAIKKITKSLGMASA